MLSNNTYFEDHEIIRIYNKGKLDGCWDTTIDWTRLSTEKMEEDIKRKSVAVATSSSHVEQIGMANAALLLQRCTDFNLKLGLAQAVNDEARHAEVFLRYAQYHDGPIQAAGAAADELTDHFNSLSDFNLIFLSHVYLENLALEQFNIFIKAFDGYILSDLYKGALLDEARHVALGLAYLKSQIKEGILSIDELSLHIDKYQQLLGVSYEGCRWIAELCDIDAKKVNEKMLDRESGFLRKLLGETL